MNTRIKLNIDWTPNQAKPTSAQAGVIRNRLGKGSAEIDARNLITLIENGGAFTPALMNGTSGDNWQSQQVIIADIDNDKELRDENGNKVKDETGHVIKIPVENPLSSDKALEACKAAGITPFCMYHSFSNGKALKRAKMENSKVIYFGSVTLEKFRIVVVLDQPITDGEESVELTARFADLFNRVSAECADTTMADKARLIFGSYNGSIINNAGSITPLEVMRALPEVSDALGWEDPIEEPTQNQRIRNNGGWYDNYKIKPRSKDYDERDEQRRRDIDSFDLYGYIMRTETPAPREKRSGNATYLNPCPICGHNDDFAITGNVWHCFGGSSSGDGKDGKPGGSIIDYIMHRENKTLQEALQKFDNLMGYEPLKPSKEHKPDPPQELSEEEQQAELNAHSASTYLLDFLEENAIDQPAIDTGFEVFNYCMDGGLYPGLYILGAISSLGKTSYLLQLADQVAAKGNDVLYFTLEMGANELIAKSISRYSYTLADKRETESLYTRSITNKELRDSLTITQQENYKKALKKYSKEVAPRLWYFESLGEIGIEEIKKQIAQHVKLTGNKPLIFIDYLQIMKPYDMLWTEKRNVDKTVIELRKIARDYKTTVFAISSLNRSSYNGDIDMDAFKESGAIEYGSDVLLGLQPRGMTKGRKVSDQNKNDELLEEARKASEKDVEIKVIKNRSGRTGQRMVLSFNAKFNYFQEGSTAKADFSKRWEQFKNSDGNVETLII